MALAPLIHSLIGSPSSIGVEAYDGSRRVPAVAVATVVVRRPQVLGHLVRAPGELGLVRAYVSGDLDLEGDLFALLAAGFGPDGPRLDARTMLRLVLNAGPAGWRTLLSPPPPPEEEVRLAGRLHSSGRDAAAISHHYDVSNEFYELLLGPSMTYSCAIFGDEHDSLETAQARKHELICAKLRLRPGQRLLDVGCGWGQMLIHAAEHHGVTGVGITISPQQAELAAKRVAHAGLGDRIEIRLQDYRDVSDGPFDAISSIGMFEHVGRAGLERYARTLSRLVVPGGSILNHAIGRPVLFDHEEPRSRWRAARRRVEVALGSSRPSRIDSALMQRYVFPDGELHELGTTVTLLQEVGLEVRHSENFREHYGLTLRRWVRNLEEHWDEAVDLVGEGRARVWRLYMSACAIGFELHSTDLQQVLAVKPGGPLDRSGALRPRVA
jgi:cyclopropane-fatty-acyl-phospholipid synthase